jgi:hypothetical protein
MVEVFRKEAHELPESMPRRFYERVTSHVCQSTVFVDRRPPLMLGILGAPGTGKTENVERTCRKNQWAFEWIAGSDLSGPERAAPMEYFRRALQRCVAKQRENSADAAVLLIDDLDLTILSTKSTRIYTEHSQLLTSAFMSYCDKPLLYLQAAFPIPIIMTMNSREGFHGALVREGRMRMWQWEPSPEETASMALEKLAALDGGVARRTVDTYKDQPIAFFGHLESELFARGIEEIVFCNNAETRGIITGLRRRKQELDNWFRSLTFDAITEIAGAIMTERESK